MNNQTIEVVPDSRTNTTFGGLDIGAVFRKLQGSTPYRKIKLYDKEHTASMDLSSGLVYAINTNQKVVEADDYHQHIDFNGGE